jgi:hypothetical protein
MVSTLYSRKEHIVQRGNFSQFDDRKEFVHPAATDADNLRWQAAPYRPRNNAVLATGNTDELGHTRCFAILDFDVTNITMRALTWREGYRKDFD